MIDESRERSIARLCVACCAALFVVNADAAVLGPVESSGSLGYFYRSFSEDGGAEDTSHQLGGTVNASTYFGEPWLATSYLSLSFTQDSAETVEAASQASTDSQLITGDLGLNVLPQSRTPFNLRFQATDSRVDSEGTGFTPITFLGEEYSSLYLGLRQSYLTDNGGRYMVNYDHRNWDSLRSGEYDDDTFGIEADLRAPQQHFIGRGSFSTNEHSLAQRQNESMLVDLSHFYYPVRHLRLDTKASYYDYDRSFLDPTSTDTRLSTLNISQVSSNAFWRPANQPLSLTAGVRVFALDGAENGVAGNDISQLVMNSGLFYQLTQKLRLDASVTSLFGEVGGVENNVHQQRVGMLYTTDWAEVLGFMYQAYLDGDVAHRADIDDDLMSWSATAGHGLGRSWWPAERTSMTSLRLNFNQSLGYHGSAGDVVGSSSGVRIDHSVSLAFSQRAWGGSSYAQITLADLRDYMSSDEAGQTLDTDTEQQLINLQLSRDQDVGRRSSITGDITLQYVQLTGETTTQAGDVSIDEYDTTTSTGRLMFQHFQMLGVPRLQFASDYMISRTSTEGAIDRNDWENRLSYMIGKLDTSLSYRLTETDSRNYDLLYFRVMRRF